jgi:hypothetical protein
MEDHPASTWGPHPKYAILPLVLVLGVVGWVAAKNPGPIAAPTAQKVTAMKPTEGSPAVNQELPTEVLYGVPTERTLHLWPKEETGVSGLER